MIGNKGVTNENVAGYKEFVNQEDSDIKNYNEPFCS